MQHTKHLVQRKESCKKPSNNPREWKTRSGSWSSCYNQKQIKNNLEESQWSGGQRRARQKDGGCKKERTHWRENVLAAFTAIPSEIKAASLEELQCKNPECERKEKELIPEHPTVQNRAKSTQNLQHKQTQRTTTQEHKSKLVEQAKKGDGGD